MKKVFLSALVFFLFPAFASAKLIEVAKDIEVDYDVMIETDTNEDGANDQRAYYRDGKLILTIHDTNEDKIYEKWRRYDENLELEMEAIDKNLDGDPDEFSLFEENGDVVTRDSLLASVTARKVKKVSNSFAPIRDSYFWIPLLLVLLLAAYNIALLHKAQDD